MMQDKLEKGKNYHVVKSWGTELWFANNKKYCGKLLTVIPDIWSSNGKFHYHKIKDETFFIIEGMLWLEIADNKTGEYRKLLLYQMTHIE